MSESELTFEERYQNSLMLLCNNEEFKILSFEFTKELTSESLELFKKYIIELAITKQKIVDLKCNHERMFLDFDFNLSLVHGNREFYQEIDLQTGLFRPMVGCES